MVDDLETFFADFNSTPATMALDAQIAKADSRIAILSKQAAEAEAFKVEADSSRERIAELEARLVYLESAVPQAQHSAREAKAELARTTDLTEKIMQLVTAAEDVGRYLTTGVATPEARAGVRTLAASDLGALKAHAEAIAA